jgi:hypothetical protein
VEIIQSWEIGLGITTCHFLLPIGLSFAVSEFMRCRGWIKFGDQLLDLHTKGVAEEGDKEHEKVEETPAVKHSFECPEPSCTAAQAGEPP